MNIDSWIKAVAKEPRDYVLRGMFADWLDENGMSSRAGGQRWLIQYRIRFFGQSVIGHDVPDKDVRILWSIRRLYGIMKIIRRPIDREMQFMHICDHITWVYGDDHNMIWIPRIARIVTQTEVRL